MKTTIFTFILSFFLLISCSKDNSSENQESGTADFKVSNTNGVVNELETLQIKNDSKNAVSYFWDFGNGVTSTEKEPNYAYPKCGNYNVKLTVTDSKGNLTTKSLEIPVLCIFGGGNHNTVTSKK